MSNQLRLFTCVDHEGHWPVGVASVIVAKDRRQARRLLKKALGHSGLNSRDSFTLDEVGMTNPQAIVLCDGDY